MWLQLFDEEDIQYCHEAPSAVRRRAIRFRQLLTPFVGEVIDVAALRKLESQFRNLIKDREAKRILLVELRSLGGLRFDDMSLTRVACVMAGGYAQAMTGQPIGVLATEWRETDCLLRIDQVFLAVDNLPGDKNQRMTLRFVVCNSRFAGETVEADVKVTGLDRWARFFHVHDGRKRLYCESFKHLLNMHCIGRVYRTNNRTTLLAVAVTTQLGRDNRILFARRHRAVAPCEYGATYDCILCGVGKNQCAYSCNPEITKWELKSNER